MNGIFKFLFFILLIFNMLYSVGAQNLPDWFLGKWETGMGDVVFVEEWTKVDDAKFFGNSFIIQQKDTIPFETVDLVKKDNRLFYNVTIQSAKGNKSVSFGSLEITDTKIVFENKENDFPQWIIYNKITPDSIVAEIKGKRKGADKSELFPFTRVKATKNTAMKKSIYPSLWMNNNAGEAAAFYTGIFKNSNVISSSPMAVTFELDGQKFMAVNGGDIFKPNPSVSFFINCETNEEVDYFWNKLAESGEVLMPLDKYEWSEKYGWIQDKFGISWQVNLDKTLSGQKIVSSFLFGNIQQGKAGEALEFYTSVFKNSNIIANYKYPDEVPETGGQIMYALFQINDKKYVAMDSEEPQPFTFSEGISHVIECDTQEEIDHYWNAFADDGQESMCGWVQDKFGVWWQVVPTILEELMSDPVKAPKVGQAFMQMKKFDIQKLKQAAE